MTPELLLRPLPGRPDVAAPPPWRYPAPSDRRLDNGMRVVIHGLPGQHIVSAAVVLDVPLSHEPRHLEGIATITARCMDEGTADHPGPSDGRPPARPLAGIRASADASTT